MFIGDIGIGKLDGFESKGKYLYLSLRLCEWVHQAKQPDRNACGGRNRIGRPVKKLENERCTRCGGKLRQKSARTRNI